MTTTTIRPMNVAKGGEFQRIWSVVRLHVVNRMALFGVPLMILGFIFAVNFVIWWTLKSSLSTSDFADASEGMQYSGASTFIFVYMMVVAVQAINLTFPFAQGYSVTRRDFYLGSVLTFVMLSAAWALLISVLGEIEQATGGWYVGGSMFNAIYFGDGGFLQRLYITFLLFSFFFFVGAATAAVYVKWRTNGMLVFFGALVLVLLAAVLWITFGAHWMAVGAWFVEMGVVGVVTWTLVPTIISGIVGFFILRRATPRN